MPGGGASSRASARAFDGRSPPRAQKKTIRAGARTRQRRSPRTRTGPRRPRGRPASRAATARPASRAAAAAAVAARRATTWRVARRSARGPRGSRPASRSSRRDAGRRGFARRYDASRRLGRRPRSPRLAVARRSATAPSTAPRRDASDLRVPRAPSVLRTSSHRWDRERNLQSRKQKNETGRATPAATEHRGPRSAPSRTRGASRRAPRVDQSANRRPILFPTEERGRGPRRRRSRRRRARVSATRRSPRSGSTARPRGA